MLTEKYVAGALVLAQSLIDSGSTIDRICMVDATVSAAARVRLSRLFTHIVEIPVIEIRANRLTTKLQDSIYGGWITKSCTKWHIMNPDLMGVDGGQYDKILFIDADILVRTNVDDLFELSAPAGCYSSPWSYQYPGGTMIDRFPGPGRKFLDHGDEVSLDEIRQALHFAPPGRINGAVPATFVAGGGAIMVAPSAELWSKFMGYVEKYNPGEFTKVCSKCRGACRGHYSPYLPKGQKIFNDSFGNIFCGSGTDEQMVSQIAVDMGRPMTHIHQRFHWTAGKNDWYDGEKSAMIHYCIEKPWDTRGKWEDTEQWWVVYERVVVDENIAGIVSPPMVAEPTVLLRPKREKPPARRLYREEFVASDEFQLLISSPRLDDVRFGSPRSPRGRGGAAANSWRRDGQRQSDDWRNDSPKPAQSQRGGNRGRGGRGRNNKPSPPMNRFANLSLE
ncbi:MAG: glycosyltransferase [Castellaniella sp.]